MTTSYSNARAAEAVAVREAVDAPDARSPAAGRAAAGRTLASRFILLILCLAIVLSTLAFGTVHSWSLALFQAGAALVVLLWVADAWSTRTLRLNRSALQLPLVGLFAIGCVQLLPLGGGGSGPLSVAPVRSLSLDPYATRFALVQVASLAVYFAAALTFVDSPRRLRLVVRTVIVFGFLLALFGMMQAFVNPTQIYWLRQPRHAIPFGPFINRHHFAAYMELALALPLGLLFAGAVERERRILYGFMAAMMALALVMTNSRGGIISLAAEVVLLAALAGFLRRRGGREETAARRVGALLARVGLGFALVAALLAGALMFGGEESLSRLVGSVNADDPTTGRMHFWRGTVEIIRRHPLLGAGLGAFGAAYTRYDTSSGAMRLEQAHNDYLQVLSDAGVVGGVLGLFFVVTLFRQGAARLSSPDRFRRGVAAGALAGCFAVLVHSLFDFSLHMTSNALLFLVLAALATLNGRVEAPDAGRRRGRRRRRVRRAQPGGAASASRQAERAVAEGA